MSPSAWAVISLRALRRNLAAIRKRIPQGVKICPAVKANAYGHGVGLILPILEAEGVEAVAVANLQEALEVRGLGWQRELLCFGAPLVGENEAEGRERAREAIEHVIDCTITSRAELELITEAAMRTGKTARVQVKVDTGMGRFGADGREVSELVMEASKRSSITLTGVYTHFASADEDYLEHSRLQLANMRSLIETLRNAKCYVDRFHAANSAAIFRLPEAALDMVRPGLALYGYWAGPIAQRPADLEPILRLVSRVIAVREMPAGASVGYGRTFSTRRPSLVGVISAGYADGYPRALSNAASVTIEARRGAPARDVPLIGRVSMDLITIDLTDVPDVRVGDNIVLWSDRTEASNSVENIARQVGSIPYEVTCGIGSRVVRVVEESCIDSS